MNNTVITIENISKLYQLGEVGTGTLSHDLNRWWYRIRGKEDPYLKLGQENRRDTSGGNFVWALRDISFEVRKGEVLGIIGRNGAGKSTLLKILSRVTKPTTGRIKVKGRIASLLEVGTGFHPELTGRDNIFLNGAILGMTKQEIKRKFDEIVDFSGVERYIDTPVKRYSSGMYVRLAFAVAAHLEPEILIVDEVLAVGDAEFQKKCLGKMKDVSVNQGRTVLFVSHNMAAIRSLCSKAVLLKHGRLLLEGESNFVISEYFNSGTSVSVTVSERVDRLGNQKFKFTDIIMMNEEGMTVNEVISGAYVRFKIFADCTDDINPGKILFGLNFIDQFDQVVLSFLSDEMGGFQFSREKGFFELVIPDLFLRADKYYIKLISFYQSTNEDDTLDIIENCMQVQVLSGDFWATGKINRGGSYSIIPGHFIS